MSDQKKIYLGVYGLNLKNKKILMIKKNRGPYKGKFDLPGGAIEFGESFDVALKREIREETGAELVSMDFLSNENYFCKYKKEGELREFHHVGIYYKVKLDAEDVVAGPDGEDSDGSLYMPINKIKPENTAPIAYMAIEKLLKYANNNKIKIIANH